MVVVTFCSLLVLWALTVNSKPPGGPSSASWLQEYFSSPGTISGILLFCTLWELVDRGEDETGRLEGTRMKEMHPEGAFSSGFGYRGVCVTICMWWGLHGFAPVPKSSRAVAFCCGIPNISHQIKVAENTRDLSGLVGGGAGVRRLRPLGHSPARSGPLRSWPWSQTCPLPFSPGICRFEGKAQQALKWRQQVLLLQNVASHLLY